MTPNVSTLLLAAASFDYSRSVSKFSVVKVLSSRELCSHHQREPDPTKQFCRVGVGGVKWVLTNIFKQGQFNLWHTSWCPRPLREFSILWSPYIIGRPYIFSSCDFYLSSFFPRLISAATGWISAILLHMA